MNNPLDILVIDKNLDHFQEWVNYCREQGLSLQFVNQIEEGLKLMESERPKLVFTGKFEGHPGHETLAVRFSEILLFQSSEIFLVLDKNLTEPELFPLSTLGYSEFLVVPVTLEKLEMILDRNGLLNQKLKAS